MSKQFFYIVSFFALLFMGLPQQSNAQNQDYSLAESYYKLGEFDKAAEYYLKSYKKTRAVQHFDKYIDALIAYENYSEAESSLQKRIRKQPTYLDFRIKLGEVYLASGDKLKSHETWDEVIEILKKNPTNTIIPIAYKFNQIHQPEYALKCYELGKKNLQGFYSYYPQMADLYGVVGEYEKMIDLYLELILINEGYLQTVQNLLNRNFDFTQPNANTQLLKRKLVQMTNTYPDNYIFPEMIIWLNLQESNFSGAFVQVKSLDRRFKENGNRLINFARLATQNEEYLVAMDAYETVIRKGPEQPYYETALIEKLTTKKTSLESNPLTEKTAYEELIGDYQSVLSTVGINNSTASSARELAEIQAQKAQQLDESILLLEKVLATPGLSKKEQAITKIDLGDYLLMKNQIWEAVVYYMQAEKAFKYDPLGDEAKLRAAKVAYYTGDFAWAAAKLDVLKGSTTKLIANDALYLSNLITDNTTIDTNLYPMQIYARADLKFAQQDYEGALIRLDSLQEYYPDHMLADEVLFLKYKVYLAKGDYVQAETQLKDILTYHSTDILGDDAAYQLGMLYELYLNDKALAMEYFLKVMTDYPDSIFVSEARKNYRRLRGDAV